MPHSKQHRTVIYASIFSMVSIVMGYCLRYATNLALAKYLKAEAYGDFVFIASIILFIGMALLLGSDEATLAFLPGYLANKNWDKAAGFIKKHLRNIIEISIFSILVGVLSLFVLLYFFQHGYQNFNKYFPYAIALCLAPLIAVMTFQTKLLRTYNSLFWSLGH
jgi:O-antigen/teichoic acid export membrane protein